LELAPTKTLVSSIILPSLIAVVIFLARIIEKYGDSIELGTVQKVVLIYERFNMSGDKQDYILNLEYSRDA
jgi:hypothetical protein